ncbi:Di-copper centre-containing protein [Morchella conica CCBAS932]|uniref:Di-copper centre-containing protein n=1 Tax=Morchella conica CCBAS932 TaxID=1392247 RepID=A0A3N4KB66_9PEZI|nr:Di-copper centre-containing protein [Morchella conica CCBAS932]
MSPRSIPLHFSRMHPWHNTPLTSSSPHPPTPCNPRQLLSPSHALKHTLFHLSMVLTLIATLLLLLSLSPYSEALDAPYTDPKSKNCSAPLLRKEWRALNVSEQTAYISAIRCLTAQPSALRKLLPGSQSRFDDFQGVHILQMENVHLNGRFLPWHRYFTAVWEGALRGSCGYRGSQPYWDWSLDSKEGSTWAESPVFSNTTGFGGNGPYVPCSEQPYESPCVMNGTGGGCITNGPFANLTLHMGPGGRVERNDHCITRDFHPYVQDWFSEQEVNSTLNEKGFESLWRRIEGIFEVRQLGLHGAGHLGVGGTLADVYSSPGDPLFYLHHANLDRLWWEWQQKDPERRYTDVSSPDMQGREAGRVTLNYELNMEKLAKKVIIEDIMKINDGILCYNYV